MRKNNLNNRIKELEKELVKDLTINDININEKAMLVPSIKSKWVMFMLEEDKYLDKLTDTLDILKNNYIKHHGKMGVPKLQQMDEMKENKKIKTLTLAIKEEKETTRFLREVNKNILNTFSYDIKNSIDITKMETM